MSFRCSLLAALLCALAARVCAAEGSSRAPRALLQDDFSIDAEPVPFDWGFNFISTPSEDAAKYESELSELLRSPLSDWEVFPRDGYTFALRPIEVSGAPGIVNFFSGTYKTPAARGFFEWLISPAGFDFIDPVTSSHAEAREAARTAEGPDGATVYPTAQITTVTRLPEQPLIKTNAFHWQLCGDNELTLFFYPAAVPLEDRLQEVQALTGSSPEFALILAFNVKQLDEETMRLSVVLWASLTPPGEAGVAFLDNYFSVLDPGLDDLFKRMDFPVGDGEECDAGSGPGGYGE